MTAFMTFLGTYWWIITLLIIGLCFLTMRTGSICCSMWEGNLSDGSALDILDRRYASGNIGSIEYEEKILNMSHRNRR